MSPVSLDLDKHDDLVPKACYAAESDEWGRVWVGTTCCLLHDEATLAALDVVRFLD